MISVYDYGVIVFYLVFLGSIGWVFRRFAKASTDYFAGGFRMTWWLVGAGSFAANFSCWTFTGAAHMAYTYGALIFGFFLMDALAFLASYFWFGARMRQLRLITAMDAVRLRFGLSSEQFFTWLGFVGSIGVASVWLISLAVVLASAFKLSMTLVILGAGGTVIVVALLGGSWAVAASDFVQLIVLIGVTLVVSILTLVEVGGLSAFLAQIPEGHSRVLHPAGSIPYDWPYLLTSFLSAFFMRNNLLNAGKYIAAKDSRHASRSALVPFFGYIVMPAIWMIPPLAAFTLVPDLATGKFATTPGESSYIAVCLAILPQGLIGLVVVCMLSSTMSGMDAALNKNAGIFVKNFYQPLLRPRCSDRELVLVGRVTTVLFGFLVTGIALLVATKSGVSLFDSFLYLGAYLGLPLAVPLLVAMLVRRVPSWAGWGSSLFGIGLALLLYNVAPSAAGKAFLLPLLGESVYGYLISNKFAVGTLVGAPLTALFFCATRVFYGRGKNPVHERSADEFFRRMETPVDFEREVGNDNTPAQARMVGWLTVAFGVFIAGIALVPNPLSGRLSIVACALVPLLVGPRCWPTPAEPPNDESRSSHATSASAPRPPVLRRLALPSVARDRSTRPDFSHALDPHLNRAPLFCRF